MIKARMKYTDRYTIDDSLVIVDFKQTEDCESVVAICVDSSGRFSRYSLDEIICIDEKVMGNFHR